MRVSGVPYEVEIPEMEWEIKKRINSDDYFLGIANLVSQRSTCRRRSVGCVLINSRKHIIATGYNGVPRGFPHCIELPCDGAHAISGFDLDKCNAIHAEQNALLQCGNVEEIHTAYCTDSPCVQCVKLLLNTSCEHIVFIREYPHPQSKKLWEFNGRTWRKSG